MSIAQGQSIIANDLIDNIYPVGSIFLTLNSADYSSYLGKTWVKLPEGKALWTASSGISCTDNATTDNTNNSIAAGLPNITGTFCSVSDAVGATGSFKHTSSSGFANGQWVNPTDRHYSFDASKSSSIYGNSTTVQPPAYKVYAWRRTK